MNPYEYKTISQSSRESDIIQVRQLENARPRTLLYGYTHDRFTWHFYLNDRQKFCLVVYQGGYDIPDIKTSILFGQEICITDLLHGKDMDLNPKRLYPESCDYEFITKVKKITDDAPLLKFDEIRYEKVKNLIFHGIIDKNVADQNGL